MRTTLTLLRKDLRLELRTLETVPADVPYLYFVSRNDGSHAFATTLTEHNRNVEIFQKRYWRERWAAEHRP